MIIPIQTNTASLNIKSLAIDTNILLWTFYGKISYTQSYQKKSYPSFVAKLIENKSCKLYTTLYNICELFNIIEKNEYDLYLESNGLSSDIFSKKQYRDLSDERQKVQSALQLIYSQINNCIEIEEFNINNTFIGEYRDNFIEHKYDVFDFALIDFCNKNKIEFILTDDSDFGGNNKYINQINIITANKKLK